MAVMPGVHIRPVTVDGELIEDVIACEVKSVENKITTMTITVQIDVGYNRP